jgi:hypothetical protein
MAHLRRNLFPNGSCNCNGICDSQKGISHCEQEELLGITEQICKMPANLVSLQIPSAALSFEIGPSMPNEAIPTGVFGISREVAFGIQTWAT